MGVNVQVRTTYSLCLLLLNQYANNFITKYNFVLAITEIKKLH